LWRQTDPEEQQAALQLEQEIEYKSKLAEFEERLRTERAKNDALVSMLRMALAFAKSNLDAFYGFIARTRERAGLPMLMSYSDFEEVMHGFTYDTILTIIYEMDAAETFLEDVVHYVDRLDCRSTHEARMLTILRYC
jgi:hypothetical protein